MKLSNRAKSALATAGYSVSETSAIAQLTAFAAQNSGIEPGNYFQSWRDTNGVRAFKSEQRDISEDWRRFKHALQVAALEGVKDEDVIAEAPHAFSGRLEWKTTRTVWEGQAPNCTKREEPTEGHWEYCTGQYFPTEYRKAAATLLEYATRRVRQARPAEKRSITTIAELKALNEKNGGCWFKKSTMRFFRTKIESGILHGRYFISSEQREDHTPRKFTVRSFDDEGSIDTIGEFHSHDTKAEAVAALREHLQTETANAAL